MLYGSNIFECYVYKLIVCNIFLQVEVEITKKMAGTGTNQNGFTFKYCKDKCCRKVI